jgi:hypothetical protein
MFLPQTIENGNTQGMIDTWRGYNHNPRIGAGELYDMQNLSSDNYPLLSPRKVRPLLKKTTDKIRGIVLADNNLTYLAGTTFYFGTQQVDMSPYCGTDKESDQQIVLYGMYALIFPMWAYVNLNDVSDHGSIKSSLTVKTGTTITYTLCNADGKSYDATVSATAPESPTEGQYWLDTTEGETGLYFWNKAESSWKSVSTAYIKITIPGVNVADYFVKDDVIDMNTIYPDINSGSVIKGIGDNYIIVTGIMLDEVTHQETTSETWTLTITRKTPDLDYVCVSNNRVWGCRYGVDNTGNLINEIYASKQGDFRNWYSYEGTALDSYAVSVGVQGRFTGCIEYQGNPIFFKEGTILKIFGSMPSNYQLITNNCRGVQEGSYRSLAILNEYLVYKSPSDVVIYDGSNPTSISANLGRDNVYYDAAAGGCLNTYHISMMDAAGIAHYFVYDMQYGLWEKEDHTRVIGFTASENGRIYAATEHEIFGVGANNNAIVLQKIPGEEYVQWFAETGDTGIEWAEYKRISRITVRAFIPRNSELEIEISYDGRPFEALGTMRGVDNIMSQSFPVDAYRADHYRLRFSGHGDVKIYTLSTSLEGGSQND